MKTTAGQENRILLISYLKTCSGMETSLSPAECHWIYVLRNCLREHSSRRFTNCIFSHFTHAMQKLQTIKCLMKSVFRLLNHWKKNEYK